MPSIRLDEVNMSNRKRILCSIPNSTANTVCYFYWHYSVIGITVTLALLGRSLQNAQCSHKERKVYREYGAFV